MTENNADSSSQDQAEGYTLDAIRARMESDRQARAAADENNSVFREYIRRQRRLDKATAKDVRRLLPWQLWLAATPNHLLGGVAVAALVTLVVVVGVAAALDVSELLAFLAAAIVAAVMYVGLTLYRSSPAAHRRLDELKYNHGIGVLRNLRYPESNRDGYFSSTVVLGLIGGWTGQIEKGDDAKAARALIASHGWLPPTRTDEISPELAETRQVLDELRREDNSARWAMPNLDALPLTPKLRQVRTDEDN